MFRKISQLDTSKGLGRDKLLRVCEVSQAHQLKRLPKMKQIVLSTLLLAGAVFSNFGPVFAGSSLYEGQTETCEASWYGPGFDGEPMKMDEIPYDSNSPSYIAHSTLPMGTMVEVTNLNNGRSIVVEVADRGPNGIKGRCVDATRKVAQLLGFYVNEHAGEAPVRVEILELPPT